MTRLKQHFNWSYSILILTSIQFTAQKVNKSADIPWEKCNTFENYTCSRLENLFYSEVGRIKRMQLPRFLALLSSSSRLSQKKNEKLPLDTEKRVDILLTAREKSLLLITAYARTTWHIFHSRMLFYICNQNAQKSGEMKTNLIGVVQHIRFQAMHFSTTQGSVIRKRINALLSNNYIQH